MATKKEIQDQIDALNADLANASDDDDSMSVTRRTLSDGTVEEVYKVPKNHPHLSWLFGEKKDDDDGSGDGNGDDKGDDDGKKGEPKPGTRNKYFGN